MSKKNQEPKRDFGFYATIPRIVRTKYKDLSHAEKWLYVCLKDLCGDKGTCFRTLRALSEETDISTGSLSKMIPSLHRAGLVHAEKKRRSESGKEVWHISITDIWTENAKVCSKNEPPTSEVVQNPNEDVQNLNEVAEDGSKNERDCSNFVDRRKNAEERTIIEEITREERKNGAAQQKPSSTPETSIHSSVPSSSSLVEFDENEEFVYGLLDEKNIGALKRNKEHKENCATLFNKGVVTLEQIDSLMQFCWQKPHLTGKDLYLKNLINCLNGWSQVQQQQKPTRVLSSYDDPDFVDDTFYPVKMTDEVLMEDVRETVHIYQADDSFDFYLQEIRHFKAQFNLTNYDVYTRIIEARKYANPERSNIDDFMHELQSSCIR